MKITIDEFGGMNVEKAEKLLSAIPGGSEKAIRSAMTRAVSGLRSNVTKRVQERYAIGSSELRTAQNVNAKYSYQAGSGVTAEILFAGAKIPLYRYNGTNPTSPTNQTQLINALIGKQWKKVHPGVAAAGHQLKGTSPYRFANAFIATMKSGHTGIFERTGGMSSTGADAVEEIMGSSVPQMIGNDEVANKLAKDAEDKFDERLAHEIDAILAGYR